MTGSYDDIIGLPHHVSATRPQMPRANRAAQFSPFAALTGYEVAIQETARITDKRIELDEYSKAALDLKLLTLTEHIHDRPEVTITYFQPDEKKEGGTYVSFTGYVKKIDKYAKTIVMTDGARIGIEDILDIDGDIFEYILL